MRFLSTGRPTAPPCPRCLPQVVFAVLVSFALLTGCSNLGLDIVKAQQVNLTQKAQVAKTFEQVRNDPNVDIQFRNGWLIASKFKGQLIFSFPPQNHPAYPSYVRKEIIKRASSMRVDVQAACGVNKFVCDQFLAEFMIKGTKALNNRAVGRQETYLGKG